MRSTAIVISLGLLIGKIDLSVATCPIRDGSRLTFDGPCTYDNIAVNGCELESLGFDAVDVELACDEAALPFKMIAKNHYQFDKNFMDGGGSFNNLGAYPLEAENGIDRIFRFDQNLAPNARIAWPEYEALDQYTKFDGLFPDRRPYMSNFNLTDSCDLRAAMCCFLESSNDEEDDDSFGNAEMCAHDLSKSKRSGHVAHGYGTYDGQVPTHCTAFAWEEDPETDSYQFRGNALYDISYGSLVRNGYRKNVPGAPMCGCIEKMPTVASKDIECRKVTVEERSYSHVLKIENDELKIETSVKLEYENCGQDFKSYYKTIASEDDQSELDDMIVDSCDEALNDFYNKKFLVKKATDQFEKPDPDVWEQVAGRGLSYFPVRTADLALRDPEFREKVMSSEHRIVYRHCSNCLPSHQHIFYRRYTDDLPPASDFNFLDMFLNNWISNSDFHKMGEHFGLFSTYEDAVNKENPWKFCNYNAENVGFPCECGPEHLVPCQWNSYKRGLCMKEYAPTSFGFYVEKSDRRI